MSPEYTVTADEAEMQAPLYNNIVVKEELATEETDYDNDEHGEKVILRVCFKSMRYYVRNYSEMIMMFCKTVI